MDIFKSVARRVGCKKSGKFFWWDPNSIVHDGDVDFIGNLCYCEKELTALYLIWQNAVNNRIFNEWLQ